MMLTANNQLYTKAAGTVAVTVLPQRHSNVHSTISVSISSMHENIITRPHFAQNGVDHVVLISDVELSWKTAMQQASYTSLSQHCVSSALQLNRQTQQSS